MAMSREELNKLFLIETVDIEIGRSFNIQSEGDDDERVPLLSNRVSAAGYVSEAALAAQYSDNVVNPESNLLRITDRIKPSYFKTNPEDAKKTLAEIAKSIEACRAIIDREADIHKAISILFDLFKNYMGICMNRPSPLSLRAVVPFGTVGILAFAAAITGFCMNNAVISLSLVSLGGMVDIVLGGFYMTWCFGHNSTYSNLVILPADQTFISMLLMDLNINLTNDSNIVSLMLELEKLLVEAYRLNNRLVKVVANSSAALSQLPEPSYFDLLTYGTNERYGAGLNIQKHILMPMIFNGAVNNGVSDEAPALISATSHAASTLASIMPNVRQAQSPFRLFAAEKEEYSEAYSQLSKNHETVFHKFCK